MSTAPAAATTLRWVSDDSPGLRRRRRGQSFSYSDADGHAVQDAATLLRIRKLVIPPAWTDVWICPSPDGHLQATGRDARGRKQYRYHADWQAGRGANKFEHLRDFGAVLPRIRQRVQRTLAQADEPTRQRVLATVVRLLDTTWLRIGNREYARSNGSFGLSTLKNRHAQLKGAALTLSFKGKSGVRHQVELHDRRVARVVRRCRELPGQELFQYLDADGVAHRIDSADVNSWLADAAGCDAHITAKDFRTWHGTVQALDLTLQACAGADKADANDTRAARGALAAAVLAEVARRLGNTPAVCRKAYIHPRVLALGEELADAVARTSLLQQRWVQQAPARAGLQVAERRLLALLRQRG